MAGPNLTIVREALGILDTSLRTGSECPTCGRPQNGILPVVTLRRTYPLSGRTYLPGQTLSPRDAGLCVCPKEA